MARHAKFDRIETEVAAGIETVIDRDETRVRVMTGEDLDRGPGTATEGGAHPAGKRDIVRKVTEKGENIKGVEVVRHTTGIEMTGETATANGGGKGYFYTVWPRHSNGV